MVATQIFLEFSPRSLGEMIQFDDHIFQMGWFNHQLDDVFSGSDWARDDSNE